MNNKTTLITWSTQDQTNQIIESTKEIRSIENSQWKEAGLNKEPVALKVELDRGGIEYFLNHYAIESIQKRTDIPWTIPSGEDWSRISETQHAIKLKEDCIGNVSSFGKIINTNFSIGYWTSDPQGERHGFVAVLTKLNNKVYIKGQVKTEGYLLRLVKKE